MDSSRREDVLAIKAVGKDKGSHTQGARRGRTVSMTGAAVQHGTERWQKGKLELVGEQLSSRQEHLQLL